MLKPEIRIFPSLPTSGVVGYSAVDNAGRMQMQVESTGMNNWRARSHEIWPVFREQEFAQCGSLEILRYGVNGAVVSTISITLMRRKAREGSRFSTFSGSCSSRGEFRNRA